jgi:hypothetical protein
MKLLTKEIKEKLPAIRGQENVKDPIVHVKFFTPDSNWTWYVTEGSPEGDSGDYLFFGYVVGFEKEWGYFTLKELESARGPFGLPIERDLYFDRKPISKVEAAA